MQHMHVAATAVIKDDIHRLGVNLLCKYLRALPKGSKQLLDLCLSMQTLHCKSAFYGAINNISAQQKAINIDRKLVKFWGDQAFFFFHHSLTCLRLIFNELIKASKRIVK